MTSSEQRPGAHMSAEVAEQPEVLAGLVERRTGIAEVAEHIARRPPRFALLAARGSSDHAALYAKYLIEVLLGLPAGLVSPSTATLYGAEPDLRDVLLISVSQSGGSPDLLEVTEAARRQGALTVAVSNTPSSPLTRAAELAVDVAAGPEQAVAATKTYTATLLALYLLVDAIRGGRAEHVRDLGDRARRTLDGSAEAVEHAVDRYRFVDRVITTGRGYSYATAAEAALKLAETSYLAARAYSGADLLHGPVAAVDEETAVLAVTSRGRGGAAMHDVLDAVVARRADVLAVGSAAADVPAALSVPVLETAEEVAPILEVLPIQRLALGLSLARGGDPDRPRGLRKITRTR
ncbi:glucosamine--fructose-6-phosphate aminotransferase (isomerizing) [Amycolatopsis arida]|uniref:Glucosamine--fructose-6-phosphate aminotransferase (Isomerizing) n=1 Tax=Amycolatopsis arida TaxID=587909 RepID=A0A1I5QU61_9PSEU|nr:SIS domain-containing protein [Amycolatopsis arida]TDX98963.1 glucosamine--fructose-6-phosphate aminotransferase (isomerizing) [Amycolatopsis arida]SFP49772.1 glucosamine--fructose-6-phosphate aminotransferase (isomerizing) [Amycolatopsis arida]